MYGEKKYIKNEEKTDEIDKSIMIFLLSLKQLIHFFCDAKEAINLMEKISIPNFAKRAKSLRIIIAKT